MNPSVLDMTLPQLEQAVVALGQPAYRAKQLADWVYRKGVTEPSRISNLSPAFVGQFVLATSKVIQRLDSTDGTIKLLIEYADGERVEAVLIPEPKRATVCLSTQAGCAMGCSFCASGLDGLRRNLTAGEILQQMLHLWQAAGVRPTNVVFMGTGEPLANYDATIGAVKAIIDPDRFGISARHVTVSTVGLPKQILRLARESLPITLAISLHAPLDEIRRELIPAAEKYTIEEIIAAADEFFHSRNREITLEYILLGGVNDTNVCAEALARIAHRLRCNVNLIRYNPVPSLPYEPPTSEAVKAFVARLEKRGVNVHVRRPRGLDADAACGQLRRREE